MPEGVNDYANHYAFKHGLRDSTSRRWGVTSPPMSSVGSPRSGLARSQSSPGLQRSMLPRLGSPQNAGGSLDFGMDSGAGSGFRMLLLRKYHTMGAAWRALDPLQHGRLSWCDFCRGLKELGGIFDARGLWESLDSNSDGFISLEEVDPEFARLFHGFYLAISGACKTCEAAWRQYFSTTEKGRCSLDRFTRAAKKLGYTGDARAVFQALNVDNTPSGVSFKDFRMLDKWFRFIPSGRWDYAGLRPTTSVPELQF